MTCPKCQVDNFSHAHYCRDCGAHLLIAEDQPKPDSRFPRWLIVFGVIVSASIFMVIMSDMADPTRARIRAAEQKAEIEKRVAYGAFYIAQTFVSNRLAAPSTADFADFRESHVYRSGEGFTVESYVDAQNAFGAKMRKRYIAKVKPVGDDNWRLVSLIGLD